MPLVCISRKQILLYAGLKPCAFWLIYCTCVIVSGDREVAVAASLRVTSPQLFLQGVTYVLGQICYLCIKVAPTGSGSGSGSDSGSGTGTEQPET